MARPHNLRGGHPFRAGGPTKPITVRVTAAELAIIDAAAGGDRAGWIRSRLFAALTPNAVACTLQVHIEVDDAKDQ